MRLDACCMAPVNNIPCKRAYMTAYLSTAWQDHLLTVLEFEKIHVVREDTQLHCIAIVL